MNAFFGLPDDAAPLARGVAKEVNQAALLAHGAEEAHKRAQRWKARRKADGRRAATRQTTAAAKEVLLGALIGRCAAPPRVLASCCRGQLARLMMCSPCSFAVYSALPFNLAPAAFHTTPTFCHAVHR